MTGSEIRNMIIIICIIIVICSFIKACIKLQNVKTKGREENSSVLLLFRNVY